MRYYVYILKCKDGSYYTGYTQNLEKRVQLHSRGKGALYTKIHKPLELVFFEIYTSRSKAMERESFIKKLSHNEKEKLIKEGKSWSLIDVLK